MSELPHAIAVSPGDALPSAQNVLFAATPAFDAAPAFKEPFPLREEGVLFAGETLPAFGLFRDVPEAQHAAAAKQVIVLHHEAGDHFAVELVIERPEARLVIARTPRLATLDATIAPVLSRARGGPSLWDRLRGKGRFNDDDVLKVPPLSAQAGGVRFKLEGGGGPVPPGARTLGRGEMYKRYFVCDGPFVVLLLEKTSGDLQLALWVEDALALAPR